MRVLFITSSYPASEQDPRGTFIHVLARSLVEQGVEVTVLAPGAPGAPKQEQRDGVEIHRATYWMPRWQCLATGLAGILPNLRAKPWIVVQIPTFMLALTWCAWRLARGHDIVHAHWLYPAGVAGAIAARVRRKPFMVTIHGSDLTLAKGSALFTCAVRWTVKQAHSCVAVSEALADALRTLGTSPGIVSFIPCGVESPRRSRGLGTATTSVWRQFADSTLPKFLFIGRLVKEKSVDTLLAAAAMTSKAGAQAIYGIVGDGPARTSLGRMAREAKDVQIMFAGACAPDEIASWLEEADALVLTSLSEGRPVVVMEAMASARAVIASDLPGVRELVDDGVTGMLFPPGDIAALASVLQRAIQDRTHLTVLGRNGASRLHAEGLSAATSARCYRCLYARLLMGEGSLAIGDDDGRGC